MGTEHDRVSQLLGAYVLDACDEDEAAGVEVHLAVCALCAEESAHLRAAATWLGAGREPEPTQPGDARLWARARAGDGAAAAELQGRYRRLVHVLARRITGDDGLAEQVTADVLALVDPGRDEAFHPEGMSLGAWLVERAHREAVRRVRRGADGPGDGLGGDRAG